MQNQKEYLRILWHITNICTRAIKKVTKKCYNFITKLKLPSITKEESKDYDKPITSKECHTVPFQLSNNKFPGLYRFSIKFCKMV